jgi:hypothetical protein
MGSRTVRRTTRSALILTTAGKAFATANTAGSEAGSACANKERATNEQSTGANVILSLATQTLDRLPEMNFSMFKPIVDRPVQAGK